MASKLRRFCRVCRRRLDKKWKKQIKQRDNFKCVLCGSITSLEVHHIVPLFDIATRAGINLSKINRLNWKKSIHRVINAHTITDGVTLCHLCHKFLHDGVNDEK